MGAVFRVLCKTLAGLLILLLVALIVAMAIGVRIDLGFAKPGVRTSLEQALGREVEIAGPVEFELSFSPALSLTGLRIANVERAKQADFLQAGHVHMRLDIPPLLRGEFTIADIVAEQVTLNLETDANGQPNWQFGAKTSEPTPVDEDTEDTQSRPGLVTFAGLNRISMQQINVHYHDAALSRDVTFLLDSMVGAAAAGEPIALDFAGRVQEHSYDLELRGGSIRDLLNREQPWSFELTGEVIDREMIAKGELLRGGEEPEVKLTFGMRDVNVGAILGALGLVDGMQASLGDAGFKLELKGDSLHEVLQRSSMAFKLRGGSWHVQVPSSEASFDIDNLYGDIRVERGNALTMNLDGTIDSVPINLDITGAPLVEYVRNQKEIPMTLDARLLDSRIQFDGAVQLPISVKDISLALKVDSERIDRFNELLRLDLPPLGPVALDSKLHVTERGYDLSTLKLRVGDSDLDGKLLLDTSGAKPHLDVSLVSKLIQLDDFDTGRQRTDDENQTEEDTAESGQADDESGEEPREARQQLLSYEVLNAFDADIWVEAQDVRSGKDRLGSAEMQVELQHARLAVTPLIVNVPGGSVQLTGDYQPSPTDVTVNLQADIEEFDVGVLVRRKKPESDMGGKFTLDASMSSRAPDLPSVMEHASGHIDFALVPANFSSNVIDLWAVNLLSAIMSKSTEQDQSQVNCVVMRMGLDDGLMEEKAIYMDTSSMQVAGESEINFKTRELDITMAPKAKRPEFFSMAMPIKVEGTFDDFGLKLSAARTAGQVIEFITSPIHVPFRRAIEEPAPADGVDACKAAWTMEPTADAATEDQQDS